MSRPIKEQKKGDLIVSADILVLEQIALAITQISGVFKKMNEGPLNRRALVILLQDMIGENNINKKQIIHVLDAAANLDQYLKKPTKTNKQ